MIQKITRFIFDNDFSSQLGWERRKGIVLRNIFNVATSRKLQRLEHFQARQDQNPDEVLKELNNY